MSSRKREQREDGTHVERLPCGVSVDPHRSVEVIGRVELAHEGAVDRDLVDVGRAKSMDLRVPVEEGSPLQESIGRELDARNKGARGEGSLLDVSARSQIAKEGSRQPSIQSPSPSHAHSSHAQERMKVRRTGGNPPGSC
jgi:hypothetical protein